MARCPRTEGALRCLPSKFHVYLVNYDVDLKECHNITHLS